MASGGSKHAAVEFFVKRATVAGYVIFRYVTKIPISKTLLAYVNDFLIPFCKTSLNIKILSSPCCRYQEFGDLQTVL